MNKGVKAGVIAALTGVMVFGAAAFVLTNVNSNLLYILLFVFVGMMFFVVLLSNNMISGAIETRATMKQPCPRCDKEVPVQSSFCMHCGEVLGAKVVCSYCAALNNESDSVCSECNALLK